VTTPGSPFRKRRTVQAAGGFRSRTINVDNGVDQYGGSLSSIVIEWLQGRRSRATRITLERQQGRWVLLEQALATALHDHGVKFHPQTRTMSLPVKAAPLTRFRGGVQAPYPSPKIRPPRRE